MTKTRMREFGATPARAIVLDDAPRHLTVAADSLRSVGFEVLECGTIDTFRAEWEPGMFDVIVADWDLTTDVKGDHVLADVRDRDWDVPFVLISGRLEEDHEKNEVLQSLLKSGSARFVERGEGGFEKICAEALALIERRDLALLRVILKFRVGALENRKVATSSGEVPVRQLLSELVSDPITSDDSDGPIADRIASRLTGE